MDSSKAIPGSTYIHPTKFGGRPKDAGGVGEQTDRQANTAQILVW